MAMLAAPRRKQKIINLRAKNTAWSNDQSKFGQRMLEKMGWSSGKGLGANENGIVEHVVAKYKNDDKGLGFEDKNDQWTKHEDDFDALLANLSNDDVNKEKLHSGVSLESKSKKSKARIHYHKFTRGKDLSRYSEKDLANIFGKKSFKFEEKIEEPVQEDIKTTEQVFTEKGSMDDYFKSKLAAFKSKNKVQPMYESNDDKDTDYSFRGFSGTAETEPDNIDGFGVNAFSFYSTPDPVDKENGVTADKESTENIKKSKKKKKSKQHDADDIVNKTRPDNDLNEIDVNESCTNEITIEKKKKSKKNKLQPSDIQEEIVPKKKKSKTKNNSGGTHDIQVLSADQDIYVPKKKKKRKNKD